MVKTKKEDGRKTRKIKGGRPPKYDSEESLTMAIEAYFNTCFETETRIEGKGKDKKVIETKFRVEMPSKAGLRFFLKIDKSTYSDYKKKFPNPIKEAEAFIEREWVQRLWGPNATGAIFYLKNAFQDDYRDRHETDLTSKGEKIEGINYILPNATNDKAHA